MKKVEEKSENIICSFLNKDSYFDVIKLDNTNDSEITLFFELFHECFGKRQHLDKTWYNWFYLCNPFGQCNNYILIDRKERKFVGSYGLSKSFIRMGEMLIKSRFGVNGMIHPNYRNRKLYSEIIRIAVENDDPEILAIAYPHGRNKGSISGHINAGWNFLKKISFFATTDLTNVTINENIKEIQSFNEIENIEELINASGYDSYTIRNKSWLNWRFFLRPHKKYNVIAFFDSPSTIKGYMVLGYYKNDVTTRCQILDYSFANTDVLDLLLNKAKQIAFNNECTILDLWLDQYSKELNFFENSNFLKTDEQYEFLYFNNTSNKLSTDIKTILSDLDAV